MISKVSKLTPSARVHSRIVYISHHVGYSSQQSIETYQPKAKRRGAGGMAQTPVGLLRDPRAAGWAARGVALTVLCIVAWWVSAVLGGVSARPDVSTDGGVNTSRLFNW